MQVRITSIRQIILNQTDLQYVLFVLAAVGSLASSQGTVVPQPTAEPSHVLCVRWPFMEQCYRNFMHTCLGFFRHPTTCENRAWVYSMCLCDNRVVHAVILSVACVPRLHLRRNIRVSPVFYAGTQIVLFQSVGYGCDSSSKQ